MINQILQQIQSNFTDLQWVHKYANLTRTATRETKEKTKESFPISCSVTNSDCWSLGKYKDLVPDNSFRSVAYWEQTSGIKQFTPQARTRASRDQMWFEADVRLIVWFNLAGLGKTDCDFSQEALTDLIKVTKNQKFTTDTYKNIEFIFTEQESKEATKKNVFDRYVYGSKDLLFSYPYDYASYKFRMRWSVSPDCIDLSSIDDPIDCVSLDGVQIIDDNGAVNKTYLALTDTDDDTYEDKRGFVATVNDAKDGLILTDITSEYQEFVNDTFSEFREETTMAIEAAFKKTYVLKWIGRITVGASKLWTYVNTTYGMGYFSAASTSGSGTTPAVTTLPYCSFYVNPNSIIKSVSIGGRAANWNNYEFCVSYWTADLATGLNSATVVHQIVSGSLLTNDHTIKVHELNIDVPLGAGFTFFIRNTDDIGLRYFHGQVSFEIEQSN